LKILKKNKAPGKKIKTTAEKRKQMSGHSIREEKMIEPVSGTMTAGWTKTHGSLARSARLIEKCDRAKPRLAQVFIEPARAGSRVESSLRLKPKFVAGPAQYPLKP